MKKYLLHYIPYLLVCSTLCAEGMDVKALEQKVQEPTKNEVHQEAPSIDGEKLEDSNMPGKLVGQNATMPNGARGPVLAQSLPLPKKYGAHFEAGVIYEQMRIGHSEIAVIHGSESTSRTDAYWTDPFRYDTSQQLVFDLEPGLTAGFALNCNNGWKFYGQTQWLYSRAVYNSPTLNSTETIRPANTVALFYIVDSDPANDINVEAHSLSSDMKINYYLLDISLSRGAFWSKNFSYEPLAGIESTWIYYNFGAYFSDFDTDGVPLNAYYVVRDFASFWGVGPMFGVNGNYYFSHSISIYSSGTFSALFGESRVTSYDGFLEPIGPEYIPGYHRYVAVNDIICPVIHAVIGLQFEQNMFDNQSYFRVRAGFDVRHYFNQNPTVVNEADILTDTGSTQLSAVSGELEDSDFGMVGLIVDIAIDF